MKNVVMEVNKKHAVLLSDNGDVVRVKNNNYTVGQRVDVRAAQPRFVAKWAMTAATSFALLFGMGAFTYFTPATVMSMDINPSVEFSANIFGIVIDVNPMNEDAVRLLEQLELKNRSIDSALTIMVQALVREGYLTPGEGRDIVVTAYNRNQEHARKTVELMVQTMTQEAARNGVQANVQGEPVDDALRNQAREYGVTPGKLMMALRYAKTQGDAVTPETLRKALQLSLGELVGAIEANEEQNREQNQGEGQNQEQNQGQNGEQNGGTTSPSPSPNMTPFGPWSPAGPNPSPGSGNQPGQ